MNVHHHKHFLKVYKKRILPNYSLDNKFKERLKFFIEDHTNPLLKDHSLKGKQSRYRSFSVTGDIRVIYEKVGDGVLLLDIGTHNQVY